MLRELGMCDNSTCRNHVLRNDIYSTALICKKRILESHVVVTLPSLFFLEFKDSCNLVF